MDSDKTFLPLLNKWGGGECDSGRTWTQSSDPGS